MDNKVAKELEKTNDILKWAISQDISGLKRFFEEEADKPLICIGSGGSLSTCKYVSLLYSTRKGLATSMTPYLIYSISEEVLKQCKVLLISHSGYNKDILAIAKKCLKIIPDYVANLTTGDSEKNELKKIIPKHNSFNYSTGIKDHFISINSVTANYALALRAFKDRFLVSFNNPVNQTKYEYKNIKHYLVLFGGWGEAAAIDFESKLVESGLATCALSDYRNFCHGRFIFAGNHCGHPIKTEVPNDCILLMLITPREASLAFKIINVLHERCKKIIIETFLEGAETSLELMLQTSLILGDISKQKGCNPLSPKNYGDIDKRKPVQLSFISDLKKSGPLII